MSNDPIKMCCLNCGRAIPAYYVCPVCGTQTGMEDKTRETNIDIRETATRVAKTGGFAFFVSLILTSFLGLLFTPVIGGEKIGSVWQKALWIFFNAHTPELSALTLSPAIYLLPPLVLSVTGYLSAKMTETDSVVEHLKRGASISIFYPILVFILVLVVDVFPVVFIVMNVGSVFQTLVLPFMALIYALIFGVLGGYSAYLIGKWSSNTASQAKKEKILSGIVVLILGLLILLSVVSSVGATDDTDATSALEVNGSSYVYYFQNPDSGYYSGIESGTIYGNASVKNTADKTVVATMEIRFLINGTQKGPTHTKEIVVGPGGSQTFSATLADFSGLSDSEIDELSYGNFVITYSIDGELKDEYTESG